MPRTPPLRIATRAALAVAALPLAAGLSACSVKEREADQVAGKKAFVAKCGSCHVLGRADTKGVAGPNLDAAFGPSLKDGLGTDGVRGVVRTQIEYPSRGGMAGTGTMPAGLAEGQEAENIAAYVADAVAKEGEEGPLLANAVPKAGGGKPIAAESGTLTVPADPNGGLLYTSDKATAPTGALTVTLVNESSVPHDIVIDDKGRTKVITGGTGDFKAQFAPGKYTFYCSVPTHRQAGMQGTLTVR